MVESHEIPLASFPLKEVLARNANHLWPGPPGDERYPNGPTTRRVADQDAVCDERTPRVSSRPVSPTHEPNGSALRQAALGTCTLVLPRRQSRRDEQVRSSGMADERIREADRKARTGDPEARRRHRREHVRAAPADVSVLLPYLELTAWNALPEDERLEVAELFALVLEARRRPMELVDVRGFGPEGEQPVARYRDPATDLVFALVPGGQFEPGLTDEQVAALVELGEFDPADGRPPGIQERVSVRPFLMGIAPVRPCEYMDDPECDFFDKFLNEIEVDSALRRRGCLLPDAHQLEWVARGGPAPQLFPWGDDLALYEAARESRSWNIDQLANDVAEDEDMTRWPLANRFGILALGGPEMWCRDLTGELATWSGSTDAWPLQDRGRWLAAVCGWVRPQSPDFAADGGVIRPVIPVGGRR